MNAPEGTKQEQSEEGGMLVAALAGVGILVAVGLLIFSGGDDAATEKTGDTPQAAAEAASPKGPQSAFQSREVDEANRPESGEPAPKTKMNPAVARMMVNDGFAADAPTRKPPKFDTPEKERAWWERQLQDALRLQLMRQRGVEKLPEIEKDIEKAADPDEAQAQFDRRKQRLLDALERSDARVAEIEAKLAELP